MGTIGKLRDSKRSNGVRSRVGRTIIRYLVTKVTDSGAVVVAVAVKILETSGET